MEAVDVALELMKEFKDLSIQLTKQKTEDKKIGVISTNQLQLALQIKRIKIAVEEIERIQLTK